MTREDEERPNGWAIRRYPDGEIGGVAFDCPGCGIAWHAHGDCRAYQDGPIPTSAAVRAAIDAHNSAR